MSMKKRCVILLKSAVSMRRVLTKKFQSFWQEASGALGEDLLHVLVLCHIGLIEPEVLAGDLLDPIQHHGGSVVIVICHHDVKASVQQFDTGVAADITGTAGNQNCHSPVPLSLIHITVDAGVSGSA